MVDLHAPLSWINSWWATVTCISAPQLKHKESSNRIEPGTQGSPWFSVRAHTDAHNGEHYSIANWAFLLTFNSTPYHQLLAHCWQPVLLDSVLRCIASSFLVERQIQSQTCTVSVHQWCSPTETDPDSGNQTECHLSRKTKITDASFVSIQQLADQVLCT